MEGCVRVMTGTELEKSLEAPPAAERTALKELKSKIEGGNLRVEETTDKGAELSELGR